ncbi:MAG: 1-acyl-sn-glycerol-3-phosphate acyltransferase [bacterium]
MPARPKKEEDAIVTLRVQRTHQTTHLCGASLLTVRILQTYKRHRCRPRSKSGPILVVANHPNGLMDPCVIRLGLDREVSFLAKSTLFENPVGHLTMQAFRAIPVFRAQDGNDTSQNNATFDLCQERFIEGGAVVIFPEGVSHSDTKMKRLKTGAARIALQTQDAAETLELHILPVGLFYEAKDIFRSRVSMAVGAPIRVSDHLKAFREEGFDAASRLTQEIDDAFGDLVLQADDAEVWDGLVAVARWTDAHAAHDVAAVQQRAQDLSAAYRRLLQTDPSVAADLADQVREFAHLLRMVGIDDPWDAHAPHFTLARVVRDTATFVVSLPFAVLGVLTSWPPYRAFRPIAHKIAGKELDLISTIKALLGLVFLPPIWLIESILLGYYWHWWVTPIACLALPFCGYVALRFGEQADARRELFKAFWLGLTRQKMLSQIRSRRAELADRVDALLGQQL